MSVPVILRTIKRCQSTRSFPTIISIELAALRAERQHRFHIRRRYTSHGVQEVTEQDKKTAGNDMLVTWQPKNQDSPSNTEQPEPSRTIQDLTPDPSLPWYLQVDPPRVAEDLSHPLAERQKLPELPTHPPPVLEPLMRHVSVDLGLDNLELIDLRSLDPPAALGSSLIMLVGSARSEKHLHVSADKCCRWLRSTYKLSPFADGLLGRNELKLKLRRKARRARLMTSVGSSPTSSEVDDGIRTGWVCVNVGQVEPAKDAPAVVGEVEGFVGFGERSYGVNIVVQMFTEEKRADVDLEGLWNGVLNRSLRRKAKIEEEVDVMQQVDSESNLS